MITYLINWPLGLQAGFHGVSICVVPDSIPDRATAENINVLSRGTNVFIVSDLDQSDVIISNIKLHLF